jgi:hypothetical protein
LAVAVEGGVAGGVGFPEFGGGHLLNKL